MCEKDLITRSCLPDEFGKSQAKGPSDLSAIKFPVGTTVDAMERELILQTLNATGNNKTRAADLLGISLKTLHNKLKEYGGATRRSGVETHDAAPAAHKTHPGDDGTGLLVVVVLSGVFVAQLLSASSASTPTSARKNSLTRSSSKRIARSPTRQGEGLASHLQRSRGHSRIRLAGI